MPEKKRSRIVKPRPIPEGFKPVPGWPGYSVDLRGNVMGRYGRILKGNSLYMVRLKSVPLGKDAWYTPRKLVAMAWGMPESEVVIVPMTATERAAFSRIKVKKPKSEYMGDHVCHDCGSPTPDYRCRKCLAKWRIKHGLESYGDAI